MSEACADVDDQCADREPYDTVQTPRCDEPACGRDRTADRRRTEVPATVDPAAGAWSGECTAEGDERDHRSRGGPTSVPITQLERVGRPEAHEGPEDHRPDEGVPTERLAGPHEVDDRPHRLAVGRVLGVPARGQRPAEDRRGDEGGEREDEVDRSPRDGCAEESAEHASEEHAGEDASEDGPHGVASGLRRAEDAGVGREHLRGAQHGAEDRRQQDQHGGALGCADGRECDRSEELEHDDESSSCRDVEEGDDEREPDRVAPLGQGGNDGDCVLGDAEARRHRWEERLVAVDAGRSECGTRGHQDQRGPMECAGSRSVGDGHRGWPVQWSCGPTVPPAGIP